MHVLLNTKEILTILTYFRDFLETRLNPIRPGLFSRSLGPRGGSEAWMPKIKVNNNWLKLNFALYL